MKKQESWKPKFLIDQNISLKTVLFLKQLGFDVKILGGLGLKGKSDEEIVAAAKIEDRAIITFGKDFGEIYYFSEKGKITVIVLYLDNQIPENVSGVLEKFLRNVDWVAIRNKLIILYIDRMRLISD